MFPAELQSCFHLDLGHLLRGERLEVRGVLSVGSSTGRTQPIALSTKFVPTETTNLERKISLLTPDPPEPQKEANLISTGAGIKVDVVQF